MSAEAGVDSRDSCTFLEAAQPWALGWQLCRLKALAAITGGLEVVAVAMNLHESHSPQRLSLGVMRVLRSG